MVNITGLDQLTKQLEQAQQAIDELDGELATVSFDPSDPASIDAAIQQANASVEAKVAAWADNPLVAQLAEGMKEQFRESIIQRAAAARLEGNDQ